MVITIVQISTSKNLENPGGLERYVQALNFTRSHKGTFRIMTTEGIAQDSHWLIRSFAIARFILKNKSEIDFIESHYILSGLITVFLSKTPKVIFFHSPWAEEKLVSSQSSQLTYRIRKYIEKLYLLKSNRIITVGKSMKEYLIKEHRIEPDIVKVIGAGVDHHTFAFSSQLPTQLNVFVARRLEARMGILEMIHAWAMVDVDLRGTLTIAGKGSQERQIKHLIDKLHLEKSVFLLGRISEAELVENFQKATFSIIPTVALEGFGLVCLESLSCGTPVVSTSVGELKYLVGENWPNLVYEAGNPAQLSKIISGISNGSLKLPSRNDCREFAAKFTWQNTCDKLEVIYQKLS